MSKNKTATLFALFLMFAMTFSLVALPAANAHTPKWDIPTYAYIVAEPDPIGVGQTVHIYMWLDAVYGAAGGRNAVVPTNGSTASVALLSNSYRFHDYILTITDPNGTATTQTFDIISDPTSSTYTLFTPDKVGTYTLKFDFPGQVYGANGDGYENSPLMGDEYEASSATTTLTVQEEQIPAAINSYPLPTEYWTRPIYGENTDWWTISSDWLGSGSPPPGGFSASGYGWSLYMSDAIGPLTSHIMWTRPLQYGGVVGGNPFVAGGSNPNGAVPGAAYFEGTAYQSRFSNPIIISGYLYYTEPVSFTGPNSGSTDCVDLRTGQVLWSRNDVPAPSFGYIYNVWNPDQHGVFPPILFTSNFGQAFDAYTGDPMFNVTGVPSGTAVKGPSGEVLRYVLANAGTSAHPDWYLAQWNSSKLWLYDINPYTGGGSLSPSIVNASNGALVSTIPVPLTGTTAYLPGGSRITVPYGSTLTVNANVPMNPTTLGQTGQYAQPITTYDWNISIPWRNTMTSSASIVGVNYGDVMLCRNGSLPTGFAATRDGSSQGPYTMFAVNLNASRPGYKVGDVMWMKSYDPPAGNITLTQQAIDFQTRVFTMSYTETMQWVGYSLDNGKLLWGPTESQEAFDYYGIPGTTTLPSVIAYGNLYTSSFSGTCYCYDDLTGVIKWTYGNGGEGNSTYGGFNVFYGHYPTQISSISNGVVYLATVEHTIPDPLYKGSMTTAVNATTGKQIWQLSDYAGTVAGVHGTWAAADGFGTFMNGYDNNIYSVGRGPSATTIAASPKVSAYGNNVVIEGSVMDISAGTAQDEQAARFPHGVPAISDDSMTDWMGYVYQQKPLPANATGVEVVLTVLDSNNNCYNIGTATTDTNGFFHFTYTPEIPGDFTVYASFTGTNAYWPSQAETSFNVMEEPSATAPPTPQPASLADIYFLPMSIVLLIAIIVTAIAIVLMLRKR